MHFVPGLRLRASEEAEILGIDDAEMGEFAYDYVGIEAELGHTIDAEIGATGGNREPQHTVAKEKVLASTEGSVHDEKDHAAIPYKENTESAQ